MNHGTASCRFLNQFGNSIIIIIFIRRVLGCVPQNPSFSKENCWVLTSSARISLISQRLHLLDLHSSFWCNPILLNLPVQESTAVPSIKKPSTRYRHHSAILRRTRRLPHPRHSVRASFLNVRRTFRRPPWPPSHHLLQAQPCPAQPPTNHSRHAAQWATP